MLNKISYGLLALSLIPSTIYAKTADEILKSSLSDEDKGKVIFTELDERDFGFGNYTVNVQMTLKNSHGQESVREMRNKTFEIEDTSQGDKTIIVFDKPRDLKGTAFLTFSRILEPDKQWMYLSEVGRVKRILSKNKSGPFLGSEFAFEDISSQEVEKYSYKYLKQDKCGENMDMECFVVERYPLYEYSGYTKHVTWVDTVEFRPIKTDFYDRKKELVKTLEYNGYQKYLDKYWRADEFNMINHQNGKSTNLQWQNYDFDAGLKENDFTKAKLKRVK